MSGADRDTEEADTQGGPCLSSRDCADRFTCEGQRCVPVKPLSVGCGAAPGLVLLGAVAVLLRQRRRFTGSR